MGPSMLLMLSFLALFIHTLSSHGISEQTHIASYRKNGQRVVSVDDFCAKGDGVTDDKLAFERAWNETCTSSVSAVFLVPKHRNYLLTQLNFTGPCKSPVTFLIKGTIEASKNRSNWNDENRRLWIVFDSIRNLVVKGGGMVNGNGHIWWQNSCKINKTLPCIGAPAALTFVSCKHLRVKNLRIKDSQQFQVVINNSRKVKLSKLLIHAPKKSPNTDGIHLDHARNVVISNCDIRTGNESRQRIVGYIAKTKSIRIHCNESFTLVGDDCISIWAGSKNVKILKIFCGPGHGISIGSLGKNNTKNHVMNVKVDRVTLNGTTNGVRIKTWQGGRGYAKHITFKNIAMHNVTNPIIIDQFYCDSTVPCHEQHNAVAVKQVLFKNIAGTSASNVSMKFNCSRTVPCRGIRLQDIELVGEDGRSTRSSCSNVHWTRNGIVVPTPCVSGQNKTVVAGKAEYW